MRLTVQRDERERTEMMQSVALSKRTLTPKQQLAFLQRQQNDIQYRRVKHDRMQILQQKSTSATKKNRAQREVRKLSHVNDSDFAGGQGLQQLQSEKQSMEQVGGCGKRLDKKRLSAVNVHERLHHNISNHKVISQVQLVSIQNRRKSKQSNDAKVKKGRDLSPMVPYWEQMI